MNKETHPISVLLSAYNAQDTIEVAINSILNQTYKNHELLIMDDGSTDDTLKICNYFEKKFTNVRVFKNIKNIGLTKSLNILSRNAKGEYLARQDSDDFSLEKRLERQLNYINKHNLKACTTRARVKESEKIIPRLSYYLPKKAVLKFKNPFIHGTLMIKKQIFNSVGSYDERFYYSQDYKLMTDLTSANYKVKILKEVHYVLNMENNISTNFHKEQMYFAECVRKNKSPVEKI